MKTLVVYATRYGSTRRSAELVAETLRGRPGWTADVADARGTGRRRLEGYEAFVLGSSIAMGRWKGSARRMLAKLAVLGRPTALFITAAGYLTGKNPGDAPDAPVTKTPDQLEAEALAKYVAPVVPPTGLKPVSVRAFGGRMVMFGKELVSNWNGEAIAAWARTLPDLLKPTR
jgi:menaquinone-dependent protoporphyrinogen IX oxidase